MFNDNETFIGEPVTTLDRIQYVIDVIEKETRQESKLVKMLLYAGLSTYTNDPINLMVNSRKPGEGKTHPITRVLSYFPEKDKILLVGSSDKAIYHEKGPLVVKDEETERWIPIESQLKEFELEEQKIRKEDKAGIIEKRERDIRLDEIKSKRNDLLSKSSKLISLEHKIIVFLDTPNTSLLEALMPLLSHDAYESKYKFTDKKGGAGKLEVTDNVLWGWPTVIFAQTIDITHKKRFPELARRFIIVNPTTAPDKVKESIYLAIENQSLPDLVYQAEVITDKAKTKAKSVIRDLKEEFLEFSKLLRKPNGQYDKDKSAVLCPFDFALKDALPKRDMNDVTNTKRFLRFQTLSTIINVDRRPIIRAAFNKAALDSTAPTVLVKDKDLREMIDIPIAVFADTEKAIELMQDASNTGLRPEITKWYHKVFLPTFDDKTSPDEKKRGDDRIVKEDRRALTTEQLSKATYEKIGEMIESKRIRDDYLEPLYNNGLVEKTDSKIDGRQNIYFPTSELFTELKISKDDNQEDKQDKQLNKKLCRNAVGRNFLEDSKLYIQNITNNPTEDHIKSRIQVVMKIYADRGYVVRLIDGRTSETEIDIHSLATIYFSNDSREKCFNLFINKISVPSSEVQIASSEENKPSEQPTRALISESGQNRDESQDNYEDIANIITPDSKDYERLRRDSFPPNFLSNGNGRELEQETTFWDTWTNLERLKESNNKMVLVVNETTLKQELVSSGKYYAGEAFQIIKDKIGNGQLERLEFDTLCRKQQ